VILKGPCSVRNPKRDEHPGPPFKGNKRRRGGEESVRGRERRGRRGEGEDE
jgi:hypothetical protein